MDKFKENIPQEIQENISLSALIWLENLPRIIADKVNEEVKNTLEIYGLSPDLVEQVYFKRNRTEVDYLQTQIDGLTTHLDILEGVMSRMEHTVNEMNLRSKI